MVVCSFYVSGCMDVCHMLDLLDLLCELVTQLSTGDRDKLFKHVLRPDVLIVLANHAAMEVRIAVVRVSNVHLPWCLC